jgi:hypothetical protein
MRGQKRGEDARKRAYDPRIHLLRKKTYESGWIAGSSPAMTRVLNPKRDYFGGTNSGRPCALCICPAHSRSTAAITLAGIGT